MTTVEPLLMDRPALPPSLPPSSWNHLTQGCPITGGQNVLGFKKEMMSGKLQASYLFC